MKKRKTPKSIVVSYRLNPAIIAKAIDGLKTYDKTADIRTLAGICKQTMLHGVNYLTHSLPFEPSTESKMIVHNLTTQGKKKVDFMAEEILSSPLKLPQAKWDDKESETDSKKTIIKDWSVSDDMREEEEGQ